MQRTATAWRPKSKSLAPGSLIMSHSIASFHRTALTLGAICVGLGLAAKAQAADNAQRVAVASPTSPGATMVTHHAATAKPAKPTALRTKHVVAKSTKAMAERIDNDGSRFQYDSCGCSGS
jgi:hypothetical protein